MPKIYLAGNKLPETSGVLSGGLAVVLHDPAEVDTVTSILLSAPRPPEDPMSGVYRTLADPSLDLAAWAAHLRDLEIMHPDLPVPKALESSFSSEEGDVDRWDESFPVGQLGKLRVALAIAKELWLAQKDEISLLSLVILFAEPGSTGKEDLRLDGDGAALVIRPGSLIGEVVRLPLRATSFAVCLMVGGGTSTTARRPEMVTRPRENAIRDGARPLADIADLASGKVVASRDPNRPLVVLIHGLFGTDVGTFKGLQSRLEEHFEVVGFPHDSLSQSIGANGKRLAAYLETLSYQKVFCVAHSRGGLVARSAAIELVAGTGKNLAISRCATFGTPHYGAAMAENPSFLIATVALLKAGLADRSVASLTDMLCCFAEMDGFPGIRDLQPANTNENWLYSLEREEGLSPDARMELFAVGGDTRPAGFMQWVPGFLAKRILGRKENDLVVRQSSSVPNLSNFNSDREYVNCNHFNYFEDDQEEAHKRVVTFLHRELDMFP